MQLFKSAVRDGGAKINRQTKQKLLLQWRKSSSVFSFNLLPTQEKQFFAVAAVTFSFSSFTLPVLANFSTALL